MGLYAVAVPPDTALWAKVTIIAGCFIVETLWYGVVAAMLSTGSALAFYGASESGPSEPSEYCWRASAPG
jgi:hypothetical protein